MPQFRPEDESLWIQSAGPRLPDGRLAPPVRVTLKDRLEMGFHLLMVLDVDRERLGDGAHQRGLVEAVLRRELAELAEDYRRNPPTGMVLK